MNSLAVTECIGFLCTLDCCRGAFSGYDPRSSFLLHRRAYLWTDAVRYQGWRTLLLHMGVDLLVHDVSGKSIPVSYTCKLQAVVIDLIDYGTTISYCWCASVWQCLSSLLQFLRYRPRIFTARCTLVQSAVLRSHFFCLSVCLSVRND